MAGGNSKAGREPDHIAACVEWGAKYVYPYPLRKHLGIFHAAAGENQQELIHARAAELVVAAQQAVDAAGHLAKQVVAGFVAKTRVPMAEVVDVNKHQAESAIHTLHSIGFTEEHRKNGFTVIDAGQ